VRHTQLRSTMGRVLHPVVAPDGKGLRPALFYGLFALLLGSNVLTLVGLLMSPDIARLMSGRNETILTAYEDRIAELRIEVDRLHSRYYVQTGDINLQLQELAQQQEVLTEQHQFVRLLADKAHELGIETADLPAPVETEPNLTSAVGSPATDIETAGQQVQQMMDDTRLALASIGDAASTSADEILAELGGIGIRPALPEGAAAEGGPLLPPSDGPDAASLVDDANAVMMALTRFKAAQGAADAAPVHQPLAGVMRISSGYGNRRDPFSGGRAFHAGLDLPQPSGTAVLAAGAGTVTFAGPKSGYGNVVEIDHGGGIVTRYAHLSAFLVEAGQSVQTGTPIAKVGSTGRSTGPHLHFEVRRDDKTLDPQIFLKAGTRLQRFLAA
jgi:murein DD-endopeptidase MepM/ murein hydrolase activator NlpD